MTLRELAAEAESALRAGPHPERARLDADTLLLHLLKENRAWLLTHRDDEVSPKLRDEMNRLIERRCHGEPLQYITGEAEFYRLPFHVEPGVLIPRPETEHLVEEVLRLMSGIVAPRIADVGTGSGAIAVALAHTLPLAQVVATDISPQALSIARGNAARNHVAGRIEFLHGDLLVPLAGRSFSVIASNPPYIPLRDRDSLSVEVRDHEPHSALFAGEDGLDIYRRLIHDAWNLLVPGGWLVMEIGYGQQPAIEELLRARGFGEIHFVPDYLGIPRVAAGRVC